MKDESPTSKKSKQASDGGGALPDLGAWLGSYNQALEGWAQASAELMKGSVELSQELITFSQSQFQAGANAWQTAMACRSPMEFLEKQRELAGNTAAQCFEEAQKITSHALALIGEAASPFRHKQPGKI